MSESVGVKVERAVGADSLPSFRSDTGEQGMEKIGIEKVEGHEANTATA